MNGFSPYGFSPSPFNSQAGYQSSKMMPSRKEVQLERSKFRKQVFPCFSLSAKGLRVKKVEEGRGNDTRLSFFRTGFWGCYHGRIIEWT